MSLHRLANPDLGRIFRGETVLGLSEWQLLERYRERRDEVAFEALLARHGPMVLAVCRRMLFDQTDVEDAFQATFLVLVRRARHLGPRDAIGPWLHGVATRVALRARCEAARRCRIERVTPDFAAVVDGDDSVANRELGEALDHELSRLPSKYRSPIVLCYLEGQTHEEAARQLKWPIGTVKGRLSRARNLLQSRLARRGLAPTVGALTLALSPDSPAAPHRELLDRTIQSTLKLALGQTTAQIVSTSIASLVEGVLTTMFLNSLKSAGMAVLLCGLAFTGVVAMARQDSKAKIEQARPVAGHVADDSKGRTSAAPEAASVAAPAASVRPDGARIDDLQKALLNAAAMEWDQAIKDDVNTTVGLARAYQASKRLMDAQLAMSNAPDQRVSSSSGHLKRIREIARLQHAASSSIDGASAQLKAYAAEADLWVAQAKTGGTEKDRSADKDGGLTERRVKDPQSQRILTKLDEAISMPFKDDTPLEEVLKYIKESTATGSYQGIPIYVDPQGLQEAEKSMTSTVRNMDVQGVPLRRTLQLLLKQLDLVYFVEDGVLCITSAENEGAFDPAMHEPSPMEIKLKKAERGELTGDEMEELVELLKTRKEVLKLGAEPQNEAGSFGPLTPTEGEEAKQNKILVELLIKQTRELVDMLNAAKQTKKAPEGKSGSQ